jgi:hypothetical protein
VLCVHRRNLPRRSRQAGVGGGEGANGGSWIWRL